MNSPVKMFCLLFLISIQSVTCFPQFSFPFVSTNNNINQPMRSHLNLRVPNPVSGFGFNNYRRQNDNPRTYNEVHNNYDEKIITVTPHTAYYGNLPSFNVVPQIPQFTRTWGNKDFNPVTTLQPKLQATTYHPNLWNVILKQDVQNNVQNNANTKSKDISETSENKLSNENPENDFKFSQDVLNDIFNNNEATSYATDSTTEVTTEYTTTEDLSGLNRSGVNGHVVATLLG